MIKNQLLIEILRDGSFWDPQAKPGLTWEVSLPERLYPDLVLLIQGARRCDKSALLMQLSKRYNLPSADCYYCNFEDPRLPGSLDHTLLSQIVALVREAIPKERACYFFLDEIQNVYGWEKWLHTQVERPKQNYFIAIGSNSCLLSGEFATALTGRHLTAQLTS